MSSHPIQYTAPLYRCLADSEVIDLEVAFLTDFGIKPSFDPGFDRHIAFDVDLTDGYCHTFLKRDQTTLAGRAALPPLSFLSRLSRQNYDAVLVYTYASFASWAICLAASAHHLPYLIRTETRWESDIARSALRRWAKRTVLSPMLRRAGACVAIGTSNRRFYRSYGVDERRIITAPYVVDNNQFSLAASKGRANLEEMLLSIKLDPRLRTLCFAGKLQHRKRPLDVLAALSRMEHPVNLIFIGDGPLRYDIDRAAAALPRVRVLGFINQSSIGQWLGVADILILPSEHETWGLVVNEAMAAGAIPVVSSAVGCGPDLVRAGGGSVYPVGDVDALAAAVDDLLSDATKLDAARKIVAEVSSEYSIAKAARGFEEAALVACTQR